MSEARTGNETTIRVWVLAAVLSAGLSACSGEQPRLPQGAAPETVSGVALATVQKLAIPDEREAVGTVRAAQTSQVASQTMGTILAMQVKEGDRVQPGQVLAVLDDAPQQAALQQATAAALAAQKEVAAADSDYALADATLKRYQGLFDRKSASPQEFDEIKARFQASEARRDMARAAQAQAEAAVKQAQTALGYTKIQAPFAGLVTEKKADSGSLAAPGMPLFTIEDTRAFRLEAAIDETDAGMVRVGQPVSVLIASLAGAELSGKVSQIVPAADSSSRTFLVKVELPADARLRSGLFGRARFARGQRSALVVPQTAIVTRGQLQAVYAVASGGIAELRYVTLGRPAGENVEVLSGLQEGERVIAAPAAREFAGTRIAP